MLIHVIFFFQGNPGKASNLGQFCDPFTGGSAYTAGSGGVPTAKDFGNGSAGVELDPFTGTPTAFDVVLGI